MYNYEQLIGMIATNNLSGIYARLVLEGRVSASSVPSVDAVKYAVVEQMQKLPTHDFLAWLETLLDVPIDQTQMYFADLQDIRVRTGMSPAKMVVNQLRDELPTDAGGNAISGIFGQQRFVWFHWVLLILVILGAVCVCRFVARAIARLTD